MDYFAQGTRIVIAGIVIVFVCAMTATAGMYTDDYEIDTDLCAMTNKGCQCQTNRHDQSGGGYKTVITGANYCIANFSDDELSSIVAWIALTSIIYKYAPTEIFGIQEFGYKPDIKINKQGMMVEYSFHF